jgi:predicted nucleotidyltransferase
MTRQDHLIKFLVDNLKDRPGIKALYLKGSLASGTGDVYSDVDFYCLVAPSYYEELLSIRESFLVSYMPIIYMSHVNFLHPQIVAIYDNNLHLDFYTTQDFDEVGKDDIKILYDETNQLHHYKKQSRRDTPDVIIDHMSDVIYTFHELDIAIKREDHLWAMRLTSHILADISLVLCTIYDRHKPVLHMKGVYHLIPDQIRVMIDSIINNMTIENRNTCINHIINLVDEVCLLLDDDMLDKLDRTYLDYIKKHIFIE